MSWWDSFLNRLVGIKKKCTVRIGGKYYIDSDIDPWSKGPVIAIVTDMKLGWVRYYYEGCKEWPQASKISVFEVIYKEWSGD